MAGNARVQRNRKRSLYLEGRAERDRFRNLSPLGLSRRNKLIRLAVIVLLFAGAASATALCAARYRSDLSTAEAFRTAPACAAAQADRSDCVLNLNVTLDRVWSNQTGRYSTDYFVTLTGPAPANGDIQLPTSHTDAVLPNPGGTVDALIWRGQVVRLLGALSEDVDTVHAPDLVAARALNWVVAAAVWCLALAALPLTLFTPVSRSVWRYATALPVLAAVIFTLGAAYGSDPSNPPAEALAVSSFFSVFFGTICALAMRSMYKDGRLF